MSRLARLAGAALVAMVGVSCSSAFLDKLSGGSRVTPGADASGDAGERDGALPPGDTCVAGFCDDFDHDPPGTQWPKWTYPRVTASGEIGLVDGGVSPPFAFQASFDSGLPNTVAELAKELGGTDRVVCQLDLFIPSAPVEGEIDYLTFIGQTLKAQLYKLYLASYNGAWNLAEYGIVGSDGGKIDQGKALQTPPPMNRWTHVKFSLVGTTDSVPGSLAIQFDDNPEETLRGLANVYVTKFEIHVGFSYASQSARASSALYDNVVCEYGL